MKKHASSILGPTRTPRQLSSTLGFFQLFFMEKAGGGGTSGIEMLKQPEAFLFLFLCFHKGALNILNFWLGLSS